MVKLSLARTYFMFYNLIHERNQIIFLIWIWKNRLLIWVKKYMYIYCNVMVLLRKWRLDQLLKIKLNLQSVVSFFRQSMNLIKTELSMKSWCIYIIYVRSVQQGRSRFFLFILKKANYCYYCFSYLKRFYDSSKGQTWQVIKKN